MRIVDKKTVKVQEILSTRANNEGLFPVKLRIIYNRQVRRYAIQFENKNLSLTPKDWVSIFGLARLPKQLRNSLPANIEQVQVRGKNLTIKDHLDQVRLRANDVITSIRKGGIPFDHDQFYSHFFGDEAKNGFMAEFDRYLKKLLKEERVGSYNTYKCAYSAFADFIVYEKKKEEISPYELTAELLSSFERYLTVTKERKVGHTTVGIYVRTLRIIYNLCGDKDSTLMERYPFGNRKNKFRIPDSRKGQKKGDALTLQQLKIFVRIDLNKDSPQFEARLYWLFSFYCQGMNFRDIFYLKYSDIKDDVLRYTRQKTKRTGDYEVIEVPVLKEARSIISILGNRDAFPSNYIFPLLTSEIKDARQIDGLIKQKIKTTNKWLKALCKKASFPEITTYWSRHTYASLLKHSGVPIEKIRQFLGHRTMKTTEHYLTRFDIKINKDINQKLVKSINSKK